jgi:hypothetical protein
MLRKLKTPYCDSIRQGKIKLSIAGTSDKNKDKKIFTKISLSQICH